MTLHIVVDGSRCVGSGECSEAAPAVFALGEDGVSTVVGDPTQLDAAEAAAIVTNCPSGAISAASDERNQAANDEDGDSR